jgi:2-amino-4-hydroxy-6-hydroxymethyldihydropteridine diphosphokinase / dihydropteroate synthase
MVVLGIGTNVGDKLANLRRALKLIKKIPNLQICAVSPVYISDALLPEGAPPSWDMPHLNLAVRCETQLAPYDLLGRIKQIEKTLGRKPAENWSPRIIDIDILAWDDLIQYDVALHIPHEHLSERPGH